MSSMRSASSSTRNSIPEKLAWRCCIRSIRRPGVATTSSTPERSASICGRSLNAAEDRRHAQRQMFRVSAHVFLDLHDQFARRRDDEHARPAAVSLAQPAREMVQDRQDKRGRLAGAGLGDADDIVAGQNLRNGRRLDRRGLGVTSFLDGFKDAVVETERTKGHEPRTIVQPREITRGFFLARKASPCELPGTIPSWRRATILSSSRATITSPPARCGASISAKARRITSCPWKGEASYYTIEAGGQKKQRRRLVLSRAEGSGEQDQGSSRILERRRCRVARGSSKRPSGRRHTL